MPDDAAMVPTAIKKEAEALALTDWAAMDPRQRERAIPLLLRRDVLSKWNAGRALLAHWDFLGQKKARVEYLDSIGLPRTTAFRLMKIARLDVFQVGTCASEQAALDAVDAMEQRGQVQVVESSPDDPPAVEPEVVDSDAVTPAEGEQALNEMAREAEPDPEAERQERMDRWATRAESIDGDLEAGLQAKADRDDRRHQDDVRNLNEAHSVTAGLKRKLTDVRDHILVNGKSDCPCCREVLARYFGVAMKS